MKRIIHQDQVIFILGIQGCFNFSSKIRNKKRMPTLITLDIVLEVLARTIWQEKEMKDIKIRKEDIK